MDEGKGMRGRGAGTGEGDMRMRRGGGGGARMKLDDQLKKKCSLSSRYGETLAQRGSLRQQPFPLRPAISPQASEPHSFHGIPPCPLA